MALGALERRLFLSAIDIRSPLGFPPGRAAELDWPALIRHARDTMMLPLLARRVLAEPGFVLDAATGFVLDASASESEKLHNCLQETAVYNTRLLAELARCVKALQDANIDHVVLKGAALMLRDYPEAAMRHAVDFDLLIDPDSLGQALTVLDRAGYHIPDYVRALAPDGRTKAEELQDRPAAAHAAVPLEGPSGVNLDLHRYVPIASFDRSGGFRGWLARSEVWEVQGVQVRLCGRTDLANQLCGHFAVQEYWEPAFVPRLLCDLRVMFGPAVPWSSLRADSVQQRACLRLLRLLFDAAFAQPVKNDAWTELLRRAAIADPSIALPWAEMANLWGHMSRIIDDIVHRPAFALRTWIPRRAYLAQRYGLDADSVRIYPLYLTRLWVAALKPFLRKR